MWLMMSIFISSLSDWNVGGIVAKFLNELNRFFGTVEGYFVLNEGLVGMRMKPLYHGQLMPFVVLLLYN